MAASHLEDRYQNEDAAREYLEAQRWPHGPVCPHCGNVDPKRIRALQGKAHRPGLYQCNECSQQFTVTVGTVFERSKIPLHKWLFAAHLMNSSKKGMSSHQLHRMLGVTYKTAWFMSHRIRLAMAEDPTTAGPIGGAGKVVEADETYFGNVEERRPSKQRGNRPFTQGGRAGPGGKRAVVALVERGGEARM